MKTTKIHLYSQGVVTEREVPTDLARQVMSRLQREGYTCWLVRQQ